MTKKHILIAEDEEHIRITLSLILKTAGYKITMAENGRKALKIIEELQTGDKLPDLLLTDIEMGEFSGLDLIEGIRSLKIDIPVIVMTAYGNKDIVVELMRKGCDEYIDKPFDPGELLQRIALILERQEKKDHAEKNKSRQYIKEKAELERKVESYTRRYEELRTQVDSAVSEYNNLTKINNKKNKIKIAYRIKPFSELGGDFIDIHHTSMGCDILIADVAGHDMGASFHTVLVKAFFDKNSRFGYDGQTFLTSLNKQLLENGSHERMITAIFLRLNLKTMTGEVTNAAHPPLIKIPAKIPVPKPVYSQGDVLGIHENAVFESELFNFEPGDRFFLRTDGITNAFQFDTRTGKKQRFSEPDLHMLLQEFCILPIDMMIEKIEDVVTEPFSYKLNDDMLLAGVEIPDNI